MRIVLIFLFISLYLNCFSQQKSDLKIGYLGQFAYQPGITAELNCRFKKWEKVKVKKNGEFTRYSTLYTGPKISTYSRVGYNLNAVGGGVLGIQTQKEGKKLFRNYSISLNYLLQSEVLYRTFTLEGKVANKVRESRHYFMPLINTGFGAKVNESLTWYSQFSIGGKIAPNRAFITMLFLEAGLVFNLFEQK